MDKNGERLGELKGLQHEKEKLEEATAGMQVAVACEGPVYGKDIQANDMLYVHLSPEQLATWEKQKALLSPEEKQLLEEYKSKIRMYF